jgi:late competence protein required for DNA uptake (superfamily II DNA/RNA helicase)
MMQYPPPGKHYCAGSGYCDTLVPNGKHYCRRCLALAAEQASQIEAYWKVANNLGEDDTRYWRKIIRQVKEDQHATQ